VFGAQQHSRWRKKRSRGRLRSTLTSSLRRAELCSACLAALEEPARSTVPDVPGDFFARTTSKWESEQTVQTRFRQFARHAILFSLLAVALTFLPRSGQAQASSQSTIMKVPGGTIEITLPDEATTLSKEELLTWVRNCAGAVAAYYGHFPVAHLTLRIRSVDGSRVGHGVTYPTNGGLILVSVGRAATFETLADDWVLTHEMVHLAFPSMAENHHWIEEGLSTYVEPVARAQVGQLPLEEVWKQFIRDMPKGQPADGDHGLDHTPTWGRTYWGGAMFCLLADVKIRERTQNRKGLRDALRAIVDHGGTISEDWEIEKALAIGDLGTGTRVLQELYRAMRDKPAPVDLDQLWSRLGLALRSDQVIFDDKAPEAAIRKAIIAQDRVSGIPKWERDSHPGITGTTQKR